MTLRYRKNDPDHNILVAVAKWVKAHGGKAVVLGPTQIEFFPEEKIKYKVVIHCAGKKPKGSTKP